MGLDLSNTAWALASCGFVDEPLLQAIAAQSIALLKEASSQTYLGNPLALVWAFWRLRQSHLLRDVFECLADLGIVVELVASGIPLMGNEWGRLDVIEVHLDEAMREVCFWS